MNFSLANLAASRITPQLFSLAGCDSRRSLRAVVVPPGAPGPPTRTLLRRLRAHPGGGPVHGNVSHQAMIMIMRKRLR